MKWRTFSSRMVVVSTDSHHNMHDHSCWFPHQPDRTDGFQCACCAPRQTHTRSLSRFQRATNLICQRKKPNEKNSAGRNALVPERRRQNQRRRSNTSCDGVRGVIRVGAQHTSFRAERCPQNFWNHNKPGSDGHCVRKSCKVVVKLGYVNLYFNFLCGWSQQRRR